MADHVNIRERRYAPGDIIMSEDEPPIDLYLIRSGKVKITKQGKNGKELALDIQGAGAIFGEMALIDKQPRSATVTAIDPTLCVLLSHHFLEQQIREAGPWISAVLRIMVIRLRSTTMQLAVERSRKGASSESQLDAASAKMMKGVLENLPPTEQRRKKR